MSEVISYSLSFLSWSMPFSKDLYDWEVALVVKLMLSLNEVFVSLSFEDQRVWALESFRHFSTKSMFLSLSNPNAPSPPFPYSKI